MALIGKYIWRLMLAALMSGAMYCLWQDAVSPAAQRIVQLVVLFEYWLYSVGLVILFQIAPLRRWCDVLLPPIIAIGFALAFWELSSWLLLGAFLGMVLFSALSSSMSVCSRVYRWLGTLDYSGLQKKRLRIGMSLIAIVAFLFLLVSSGMHGFPIYFIIFPFLIVLVYGLYCLAVYFFPVALLLFFNSRRNWKAWIGLALSVMLWLALLGQTFPIRMWWMQHYIDPCYEETVGGKRSTYEKLPGTNRVCVLPAGEGPFNMATRQTMENFDASQFVEQQQILDDASLKTVYIPKEEYRIDREHEREAKLRLDAEKRSQSGTEENRRMHVFQDAWVAELDGYLETRIEACPPWERCKMTEVAYFVVTSKSVPEYITLTSQSGFDLPNFRMGCDIGSAIRYIPEQKIRSGVYQRITGEAYRVLKSSSGERPVTVRIDKPSRPDEFGTDGVVCMTPFDRIQIFSK